MHAEIQFQRKLNMIQQLLVPKTDIADFIKVNDHFHVTSIPLISFIKMRKKLVILNFSFLVISVTAVQFNILKEHPLSNDDHLSSSLSHGHGILCPVWFTYNNTSQQCICGDDLGGVIGCNNEEQRAYIMRCYCMTYIPVVSKSSNESK